MLVLTLALSAAVASCSSGAGSKPSEKTITVTQTPQAATSPPRPSTHPKALPRIREAVQGYSDAFLQGDADSAWAYLTDRCQGSITEVQYGATVTSAGARYGAALPFAGWRASIHGVKALVTYTYASAPELDQTAQEWTFDGASWLYDAC